MALAVTPPVSAEEAQMEPARGNFEELVIDGDRDGVSVTLDHDHANERLADRPGRPCAACHHADMPDDEGTPCADCHRAMDAETDIFNHDDHIDFMTAQEGSEDRGCAACHSDPDAGRDRETVRCENCHVQSGDRALWIMVPEGSRVGLGTGIAPSYEDAMHGICQRCHEQTEPARARCPACHRPGSVPEPEQAE
jgi:hypothetical protein